MGQSRDLSCLQKLAVLNQSASPVDKLIAYGDQFQAAGRIHDAVDFFERAGAAERLTRVLEIAAEEGDVLLFRRVNRALGREATGAEWQALAAAAQRLGKTQFARQALDEAGVDPGEMAAGE